MSDVKSIDEVPVGSFYYFVRSPQSARYDSTDEWEADVRRKMYTGDISKTYGLWELIHVFKSEGRPDKIKQCLTEIMEGDSDPETRANCYHAFGCLAEQEGDFFVAAAYYQKAIESFQSKNGSMSYWIHNNLAYSLIMLSHYQNAVVECQQAIEIDPTRQNAYKNLGLALTGLGQFVEAAQNYVRATKANAADPRSLKLLEELYQDHPELEYDIEGFQSLLENCRTCVKRYSAMRDMWC